MGNDICLVLFMTRQKRDEWSQTVAKNGANILAEYALVGHEPTVYCVSYIE
jgi:hypothetical protein